MECLLPYLCMVTVPHITAELEKMLDYRGVGLERFHCIQVDSSDIFLRESLSQLQDPGVSGWSTVVQQLQYSEVVPPDLSNYEVVPPDHPNSKVVPPSLSTPAGNKKYSLVASALGKDQMVSVRVSYVMHMAMCVLVMYVLVMRATLCVTLYICIQYI